MSVISWFWVWLIGWLITSAIAFFLVSKLDDVDRMDEWSSWALLLVIWPITASLTIIIRLLTVLMEYLHERNK